MDEFKRRWHVSMRKRLVLLLFIGIGLYVTVYMVTEVQSVVIVIVKKDALKNCIVSPAEFKACNIGEGIYLVEGKKFVEVNVKGTPTGFTEYGTYLVYVVNGESYAINLRTGQVLPEYLLYGDMSDENPDNGPLLTFREIVRLHQ